MGAGMSCIGKASVEVGEKFKTNAEMSINVPPKQNEKVETSDKSVVTDKQEKENEE